MWIVLALAMAAGAFSLTTYLGVAGRNIPTFSAIDERAHFDYAIDLSHGHVPRWGDLFTPKTVQLLDCLGIARTVPEPCTTSTDPRAWPPKGFSYEAQQPPLAYVAYVPFLTDSGSAVHQLSMARRGGLVWLALADLLLVAVAWLADMNLLQVAAILTICALEPQVVHATTTVTNDSGGLVAGALSIVMVQLGRRRGSPLAVAAFIVGIVVGLFKGFYLVAPLALLIGGLLTERRLPTGEHFRPFWRRRGCEISLFAGAVVSYGAFVLLQDLRAAVPPHVVLHELLYGHMTHSLRWSTIELSIENSFNLFIEGNQPLYFIWNLLVYGSVLGLVLNRSNRRRRAVETLAFGTVVGLLAVTVSVPVLDFLQGHYDFYGPTRYALPMLPIIAYLVARSSRPAALALTGVVVPALATYALHHGHPF